MDMSPAYIAGVEENIGSQAVMVFDKYHVIAHVNDAVNAVRRAEIQIGGWETRDALKGSRGGAGKRSQWDRKEKEYALGGKPQAET